MRITAPASVRRLRKAIVEQRPEPHRRDDRGLTTLEWLLIVAAVAGLAALAVVLVTNVVSDTSEQIAGQKARLTSAQVQAQSITDDPDLTETQAKRRCDRLPIAFTDVGEKGIERTWTGGAIGTRKCEVRLKS